MKTRFSELLAEVMEAKGVNLTELSDRSGLGKSSISEYLSGKYEPKQKSIYLMAEALHVDPVVLLGLAEESKEDICREVPIIGDITPNQPITTSQRTEGYELTNLSMVDFILRVRDDSMSGARIRKGDLVYVNQRADIKNGDTVVCLPRGVESAQIRLYYKYGAKVVLRAADPAFEEAIYPPGEVRIVGKVVRVVFSL
jgi:repressor LexA